MSPINLQIKQADVNYSVMNTGNTRKVLKLALYSLTALVYAFLIWQCWIFVGGAS